MSNHSKALAFINRLVERFGKGGYIFRGTTTRYSLQKGEGGILDGINSNLYRWVVKDDKKGEMSEEQENLRKIFTENEYFSPSDMEKEIVENARKHFPSNTENHEIITELQHFGGKTNMIDFSRNMYVALFFACQGNFNKSGELIALREEDEKKFKKIKKIDYNNRPQKGALEIIDPTGAQNSRQRVHFQSSVFVRPANGYINPKECEKFRICGKLKKPLSEYLRVFHNLTEDTVYNDLHGFINNERNNETASLYFYMGLKSQKKGEYESAILYYGKCIQINPSFDEPYSNRGSAYNSLGQHEHAIKDFNQSISINRNSAIAYSGRGNAYDSLGQHERAIKDFNESISLNPNSAATYNNRGNAYDNLGQHERAIEDFDKAISLDPNLTETYNNRGVAYSKLEQYEQAIKDFNQSISLDSDSAGAYHNRGNAYDSLGQHERAIKDFNQSISLDPDSAETYNNRGIAYINMGENKRAIEDFDKAISLKRDYAEAYHNRGAAYYNLAEHKRAIESYDKAISLDPDYAEAHHNRGLAKKKMGNIEGANADFAKARELGYSPPTPKK